MVWGVHAKIGVVTSSHSNHVWAEESDLNRGASAINSQEASKCGGVGVESAVIPQRSPASAGAPVLQHIHARDPTQRDATHQPAEQLHQTSSTTFSVAHLHINILTIMSEVKATYSNYICHYKR